MVAEVIAIEQSGMLILDIMPLFASPTSIALNTHFIALSYNLFLFTFFFIHNFSRKIKHKAKSSSIVMSSRFKQL